MPEENNNKNIDNGSEEQRKLLDMICENDEPNESDEPNGQKKSRRVKLSTFICSAIALVLAAVMITYTVSSGIFQKKLADFKTNGAHNTIVNPEGKYDALELLELFFKNYSFEELDDEKQLESVIKAFVHATGDKYAEYYTAAEYQEFLASVHGEGVGIGVSVLNDFVKVNGVEHNTIKILKIFKDSPAANSDLRVGDYITWIGTGEDAVYVGDVGYTAAVNMLRGEKGTDAEFVVLREDENGEFYTAELKITRDSYTVESVSGKKLEGTDIGLVAIDSFDVVTPTQFLSTMDRLIGDGCNRFVFDMRNNPGGDLDSIVAVLSFILEKGDTIITMEAVDGTKQVFTADVIDLSNTERAACSVTEENLGKYADYEIAVLCNENTASAAELFVSNIRDHEIGAVVGVTTYGKGVAQSTISLASFGIDGYLKYTSKLYYSPSGENYDGVGIVPDIIEELSDEAKGYNLYEIPPEKDNQLQKAIEYLNK